MSENTGAVKEESPTKNVEELIEVLSTKPETPTLNQDSPKNDFFILQDFWPLFKFSQILGFFPCKKEMDEKGAMELKPIRWWISVIRILGLSIFVTIPRVLLGLLLISSSEEASDYINNEFLPRVFLSNSARSYVTRFFMPVNRVLLLSCFLSFVIKRKKLCALQAIFSSPLNDMTMKRTNTVRKARVYSILIITLSLIAIVATVLYIYLPLLKLLTNNASIVLGIFIAFLNGMYFCIFHFIMINTVILYFQLTCNIINLIEEIDLDSLKFGVILENTANLMKKVKTSSFLSLQCFFMILFETEVLILMIYLLCEYLTATSQFPIFFYVCIAALVLQSLLGLCILNWQSYDVMQRLGEIRFSISIFAIKENNIVVIDEQKHPEEYARKIVMSMLEEFKGFDANGYFTLGKELLGGIIMLCMTYVFVLIQLKHL